ncbi:LisH/CRA/RING-U-box domains-containing protein [Raphanus sativus]|uniref:Protein RMD5 homolog n=1 Tax=Raphanus sativus TaxID=3726 RepID=A0A6J0MWH2_RAPSA|nr:protein RMD5 homolog [Raphanus sativus]KAJ4908610.1 LisH/CRA/RING-U-box domains-containing protein [Raphanus sativus]
MDNIATVKDGFNQVAKRQKHYHSTSQAVTDRAFEGFVESLVQILRKNDPKTVLTELKLKLGSLLPMDQLQESQKEWNTSLAKFEKALGKSDQPDDMFPASSRSIDLDHELVDKMLVEYLYRQGLFEVGDCLVKEAQVEAENEAKALSLELHRITEPLKQKDIEPAMQWISENREKLKQHGQELELELVSLKYWEMLRQGKRCDALRFARAHFPKFATLHSGKIQRLIVALLWIKDLENYPHAEEELCWDKTSKELTKRYHHLHDQPSSSPLADALSAGIQSLPKLLKLVRVMGLKKEEWGEMKQLPVDLELGDEFRFHSVFVCPVSREQSDEYNPPMMMPCRHVLCKQTISRLSKSCSTRRFKCPYCTSQTTASACRQLYI